MKKILLTLMVFFAFSIANAQLFKKKKTDCPSYSESIVDSLTVYEPFSFEQFEPKDDTLALSNRSTALSVKPDTQAADSVLGVLKKYYETKTKSKGYRIQLWTGQNHVALQSAMSKYNAAYQELEHHLYDSYDKTTFRFKIGDFTDRLEAYRCLQIVKSEFPRALLVPDDVYLKRI